MQTSTVSTIPTVDEGDWVEQSIPVDLSDGSDDYPHTGRAEADDLAHLRERFVWHHEKEVMA